MLLWLVLSYDCSILIMIFLRDSIRPSQHHYICYLHSIFMAFRVEYLFSLYGSVSSLILNGFKFKFKFKI